jgi:hypothetical protein
MPVLQDASVILAKRDAFSDAVATEQAALRNMRNFDLDVKIAERNLAQYEGPIADNHYVQDLADAQAARTAANQRWWEALQETKAAAKALCDVLGVDPAILKGVL